MSPYQTLTHTVEPVTLSLKEITDIFMSRENSRSCRHVHRCAKLLLSSKLRSPLDLEPGIAVRCGNKDVHI